MVCDTCNYYQEYLHSHIIQKIILLKHVLLEMTDLEILDNKKLNKELEEDGLSNIVDI